MTFAACSLTHLPEHLAQHLPLAVTEQALPVLREYDVPATLNVPTALMQQERAPYEFRLGRTLLTADDITIQVDGHARTDPLTTLAETRTAYGEIRTLIEEVEGTAGGVV